MNTFFEFEESLFDVTERYPELIELLFSLGLENVKDDNMRRTTGKNINLNQLLEMKKINKKTFEDEAIVIINENNNDIDSSLGNKKEKKDFDIKIDGVLPCPVRIPLMEGFEKWLLDNKNLKESVNYNLQAASMGVDWLKESIKKSESADILSDLFISAGFDLFFDRELIGKYKEQGVFEDITKYNNYNKDFENDKINLRDPDGQYSMLAVVPAVFLVNVEELNGRKCPESWEDILDKEFENSVSLPIGDFDLFNAILLNINKKYGIDGVEKLGKSLLKSMHPSEMVKSHIKKTARPAVTIMPYFFTRMTKNGGPMKAVWPIDGAIISPIFMLSKKESKEKTAPFVDFFSSKEVGEILSHQGLFPSVNPHVKNELNNEYSFMWLGWDYIKDNDIGEMIRELEKVFKNSTGGI